LEVDDLDGFRLRHMTLATAVGVMKPLDQSGDVLRAAQMRDRYGHLIGLAAIAHARAPVGLETFARELLPHQVLDRSDLHFGKMASSSAAAAWSSGQTINVDGGKAMH
jgi:hypothetical protein